MSGIRGRAAGPAAAIKRSRIAMKFVTFRAGSTERLGVVDGKRGILDLAKAGDGLPGDMLSLIEGGEKALAAARKAFDAALSAPEDKGLWSPYEASKLLAPIPHPRKNIFCVG